MIKVVQKSTLPKFGVSVAAAVSKRIGQGNQAGAITDVIKFKPVNANTGNLTVSKSQFGLRVLNPIFMQSIGGEGNVRSFSVALEQAYNTFVGTAYDTTTFNRADLGKHFIVSESYLMAVDIIDRLLDAYNCKEYINMGADQLGKWCGFGIAGVDFDELCTVRNEIVPLIAKLLCPNCIPWLNEHRSYCRHVFADDVHDKTQFIIPLPRGFYWSLNSNGDLVFNNSYQLYLGTVNPIQFMRTVIGYLETYLESAAFKDISPYLWTAMLRPNGPKVATPVTITERSFDKPNKDLDVIFDYDLIQSIRNADFVGNLANMNTNVQTTIPAGDFNIYEDNETNLRQGRYFVTTTGYGYGLVLSPLAVVFKNTHTIVTAEKADYISPHTLVTSADLLGAFYHLNNDNKEINVEDFPTNEDTLTQVVRNLVRVGTIDPQSQSTNNSQIMYIASCSTTLWCYVYLRVTSKSGGSYSYQSRYYIPVIGNRLSQITGAIVDWNSLSVYNSISDIAYGTYATVSCAPTMTFYNLDNSGAMATRHMYIDEDNLVEVPASALFNIHELIAYHAMDMDSNVNYAAQGDKSSSDRKSKRRKSKDKKSDKENDPANKGSNSDSK